jgi:1-acyl-sn-glycerol-3-phosphate acyltransferase
MPETEAHYTYHYHRLIVPTIRVLLGIPSSISHDATLLLRGAQPAPRVLNPENIPLDSPFILTLNHYDRPGLAAWWGAAVMLCAIATRRTREPRDIHLAIAREWWYPRGIGRAIKQPLTNWFFGQLAKAYGLIRLPPVLGDDRFRGEGALAIRRALALTRGNQPQLVGLAPEGHTGDNLSLCHPPTGAGLFLLMLTHDTLPILPAGIFEDDDKILTVNFGAPFQLSVPRQMPRPARDAHVARQVMVQIGKLLPERMWGAYCEEIRKA